MVLPIVCTLHAHKRNEYEISSLSLGHHLHIYISYNNISKFSPPRSWLPMLNLKTTTGTVWGVTPCLSLAYISQHQLYAQVLVILSPK